MKKTENIYEFAFRGLLAEEALGQVGHKSPDRPPDEYIYNRLALDDLDDELVSKSKQMSIVYMAIAAFENSARKLITTVLLEQKGDNWWASSVAETRRKNAEKRRAEEQTIKYHGQRGEAPIYYTEMNDLANIIRTNWVHFQPFMPSIEWAESIFSTIERSRNVIMHSGTLGVEDIERVGINIRDWVKQVGA